MGAGIAVDLLLTAFILVTWAAFGRVLRRAGYGKISRTLPVQAAVVTVAALLSIYAGILTLFEAQVVMGASAGIVCFLMLKLAYGRWPRDPDASPERNR